MLLSIILAAATASGDYVDPEARKIIVETICKPAIESHGAMTLDDFIPPKFPPKEREKVKRICVNYMKFKTY